MTGRLGEAGEHIGKAVATGRSGGALADLSLSLTVSGLLRSWEADYTTAVALHAEALAIARRHDLLLPLMFNTFLHGMTLTGKGDYEAALSLYLEGLTLAERVGDEAIHHRLLNCLGWLHAELGDLTSAIELNRRSAEVGRRRRDPGTFPNALVNLGENHLAQGRAGPGRGVSRRGARGLHRSGREPLDAVAVLDAPLRGPRNALAGAGGPGQGRRLREREPRAGHPHEIAEEPGERAGDSAARSRWRAASSTRRRTLSNGPWRSPGRSATRRSSGRRMPRSGTCTRPATARTPRETPTEPPAR